MGKSRYLSDFRRAFLKALWSGFGTTDTAIVVIIVFLFPASFFTDIAEPHLPGWLITAIQELHPPGWFIVVMAATFVLYEFLRTSHRLYAGEREQREQLEQQLVPQLVPEQPHTVPTMIQTGPGSGTQAVYVRVPIRNSSKGTAYGCAAKLLEIEFLKEKEGWHKLPYRDTLDMPWANKPTAIRELNLDHGSRELHLATLVGTKYPGMMSLAGEYRFTFLLTSNNAASRTVRLKVHWNFDIHTLRFPTTPLEIVGEEMAAPE